MSVKLALILITLAVTLLIAAGAFQPRAGSS
jgi:hypothetical protein